MNYAEIKKLDEESLKKLTEGKGPSDKCICSLISPPEDLSTKKGIKASIKRAIASISGQGKRKRSLTAQKSVDIPVSVTKAADGSFNIQSTKESVKRQSACGKCGCDNENIVLKHSFANIRITSPDLSTICPCPSDCLPDKAKLQNNIKVMVERLTILDVDSVDSEFSLYEVSDRSAVSEPIMDRSKFGHSMTDSAGEWSDGSSEWSSGADSPPPRHWTANEFLNQQ